MYFSVLSDMIHEDKHSLFTGKNRVARENYPQQTTENSSAILSPPFCYPIQLSDNLTTTSGPSCPPKRKKMTPPSDQSTVRLTPIQAKRRKVKQRNPIKRTLFPKDRDEVDMETEVIDIVPNLLDNLKTSGHLQDFVCLLRLISVNKFPLQNISFLLLMDVARWYSLPTTTQMTYPD